MSKPTSFQRLFGEELVLEGSVLGVRTWFLSLNYHLTGLKGGVWGSGENRAVCLAPRVRIVKGRAVIVPDRGVADLDCQCGYYAYFEPKIHNLLVRGVYAVVGVIQGYGRTTVGPIGFRSEKAKILAMFPFRLQVLDSHVWEQLSRLTKNYGTKEFNFPIALDENLFSLEPMVGKPREVLQSRFPDVAFFEGYEPMMSEYPTKAPRRRKEV